MKTHQNQVRIIAGRWRSRKINFPDIPGLRPSSDRIRESLFNWLMNKISGAECLDLFAGSGILGLEALSRGAHSVVAVDQSPQAIKALKENAKQLFQKETMDESSLRCILATWSENLSQVTGPFDLVFVDPPFKHNLVEACCAWLEGNNLLKAEAWVYVEQEFSATHPKLPENWELYREMKTQKVRAILYRIQNKLS